MTLIKMSRHIQKVFIAFLKVFMLLSICAKFQVNKQQFSLSKENDRDNFTPTIHKQFQGQNTSVGIELIELTDPSDTLNHRPFFKHYILQTVLHVLFCFYLCETKPFVLKTELYLYFLIWFELTFSVTVLNVLCFWCSFCNVIGNQVLISYSRYNLLGIAIKTVL